jgi:hypothetical protein
MMPPGGQLGHQRIQVDLAGGQGGTAGASAAALSRPRAIARKLGWRRPSLQPCSIHSRMTCFS